jgi:uncharacterized protein YegP (UPF0339 family)
MGTFEIIPLNEGFAFTLKAKNGKCIATSQSYSSKSSCKNGIESVRKNAAAAIIEDCTHARAQNLCTPRFEIYYDDGCVRFKLKAKNAHVLLISQSYHSKDACKNGIFSVIENAPTAKLAADESCS